MVTAEASISVDIFGVQMDSGYVFFDSSAVVLD
jgi:hypothetical protein